MAGLYDYTPGINAINQSLMNFSNTINSEKQRREQQNVQNIINTKNMFELDRLHKQEVENDKPVMFLSMLEARGTPKSVLDKTLQYGRSMGVMDEVGRVTKRNIPAFMTAMNSDKQFQLDITQGHFDDVSEKIALMDQDIEKMREKQDPNKQQDFANLIRQRDQLKVKQMNYKGMMDNLLGRKQDTSLTEAEILALPENHPQKVAYIKGRKELEGNKPAKFTDWGYGQKRNETTGEIVSVPVKPKETDPAVAQNRDEIRRMRRETEFNKVLTNAQKDIEKLDAKANAEGMTNQEYNRQVRNIKSMYGKQLETFKKDGLWNGWAESKPQTEASASKPEKSKSGKDIWKWPDGKYYYEPPPQGK